MSFDPIHSTLKILQDQINDLLADIANLQERVEELTDENEELRIENEALEESNDALAADVADLQEELNEWAGG